MIERQIEEKEGNEPGRLLFSQGERVMCPSCKEDIHEVNLPDVKRVVEDTLSWVGFVLVNSSVCFLVDCEHRFADWEMTLDEPHELTTVVVSEFNGQEGCIHFEIKEIRVKR